jgi:Ca2+-binding RTX toxin-like protein
LLGEGGDDLVVGGHGRDVIIGGLGKDKLVGNQSDDILIAGTTAFDADAAALGLILAEWTSSRSYAARAANLMGTGSGQSYADRLNGNIFLRPTGASATVFDDGAADVLTGSEGQDWFIFNADGPGVRDKVTDLQVGEDFTELDLAFITGP